MPRKVNISITYEPAADGEATHVRMAAYANYPIRVGGDVLEAGTVVYLARLYLHEEERASTLDSMYAEMALALNPVAETAPDA